MDPGNEAAYTVAKILTENEKAYNPAIIYGPSGCGKSLLMDCIEAELKVKGVPVKKMAAEQLVTEIVDDIRKNTNTSVEKFCERFEDTEVLIVEDLQYLRGLFSTQEQLYWIMNELIRKQGHQIVLTMNTAPQYLEHFNERLIACFPYALQIQIDPPSMELKLRLLDSELGSKVSFRGKVTIAYAFDNFIQLKGVCKTILFCMEQMGENAEEQLIERILKMRVYESA